MKIKILRLLCVCFVLIYGCKQQNSDDVDPLFDSRCSFISLSIDGSNCAVDRHTKIFLYPIKENLSNFSPFVEMTNAPLQLFIRDREVENSSNISFGPVEIGQAIPIKFISCDGSINNYLFVFTSFPIIQIHTNGVMIHDEPKQAIFFQLNDPHYVEHGLLQGVFHSVAGIEHRGASSQVNAKKSYGLELWSDETGNEKFSYPLFGMRDDDDWILDAMFRDHAKMRNRVCMDIWLSINQLHYQEEEPFAQSGCNGLLVEVFQDDQYQGLFNFMEKMDKKQLQLKKSNLGDVEGLLYKSILWAEGIVTFENYFPADPTSAIWDGWEQKYPEPEDFIYWEDIDHFTQLVVEASDDIFVNQIGEQISISNVIDYFIFLNLIRGDDNRGKNVYLSRYKKNDPFTFIPWDMDATWGRNYLGDPTSAQGIISNRLFDRLLETSPDNFRNQLKLRWFDLRNELLINEKIKLHFDQYFTPFEKTGAYLREKNRWGLEYDLPSEKNYIETWIDDRLLFLDDYFQNL